MFSHRFVRAAVFRAFIAAAPFGAFAQSGTSAISGFVKDGTGAALPGATVKIVNAETRVIVEVITNGEGAYRAASLVPGPYRVETALGDSLKLTNSQFLILNS